MAQSMPFLFMFDDWSGYWHKVLFIILKCIILKCIIQNVWPSKVQVFFFEERVEKFDF